MKIPKVLHQIWLGPRPMHPLMVSWRERLAALHPGWELNLWREGGGPATLTCGRLEIASSYPELLARACHLSQRSNIWRYEIVSRFGGVYLDTDVEPLRPFDDLLAGLEAFVARKTQAPQVGFCWQRALNVPPLAYVTGLFGCVPGHPWTAELLACLTARDPSASLSMGTDYFTSVTLRHPKVTLLPERSMLFEAPADWAEAKREKRVPEAVYRGGGPELRAVHHWSSLWYPTGFEPLSR